MIEIKDNVRGIARARWEGIQTPQVKRNNKGEDSRNRNDMQLLDAVKNTYTCGTECPILPCFSHDIANKYGFSTGLVTIMSPTEHRFCCSVYRFVYHSVYNFFKRVKFFETWEQAFVNKMMNKGARYPRAFRIARQLSSLGHMVGACCVPRLYFPEELNEVDV